MARKKVGVIIHLPEVPRRFNSEETDQLIERCKIHETSGVEIKKLELREHYAIQIGADNLDQLWTTLEAVAGEIPFFCPVEMQINAS